MTSFWTSTVVGAAIIVGLGLVWRRWRAAQLAARKKLAILEFEQQRGDLGDAFLAAAAATGKPRGLRWKSCDLQSDCCFAEDRVSGELMALVGATISFEAIEGGDMEDVEAVGNLRSATTVFVHRNGQWGTEGRTIFNLEPNQTLQRFSDSLSEVTQ